MPEYHSRNLDEGPPATTLGLHGRVDKLSCEGGTNIVEQYGQASRQQDAIKPVHVKYLSCRSEDTRWPCRGLSLDLASCASLATSSEPRPCWTPAQVCIRHSSSALQA